MRKFLILVLSMLAGCAALKGQNKYTGSGTEPVITERIVRIPEMQRRGLDIKNPNDNQKKEIRKTAIRDYWLSRVDKIATVSNPRNSAIKCDVSCIHSFPGEFNFVVPAHTSQDMLFTTTAFYMYEKLCSITHYSDVK